MLLAYFVGFRSEFNIAVDKQCNFLNLCRHQYRALKDTAAVVVPSLALNSLARPLFIGTEQLGAAQKC